MYSKVLIVHGTYINEDTAKEIELQNVEPEELGFETLYHGSSPYPIGYCGVELGEFDECTDALDVTTLNLTPTEEQKKQAQEMFNSLDESIKDKVPSIGTYFVFFTS